ncbi:MAG: peptidyl-prolyl cis-trans isomerase [Candidatus Aminicenantes bacterium]|nr:peptidyl-prolyl cis-trans isomerase [Candidatus Aminicenantes bacterium]
MLKSMRKNIKSLAPTLWFVIAAFIISIFAVWGGGGRLGEGRNGNVVATVGSKKITGDVYFQSLRMRLEQLKKEFSALDSNFIQQLNIPQQVLQQIIQRSLISQLADDINIKATNQEVLQKIKSYPVFQREGQFIGFQDYKRILEMNHMSISEFEDALKSDIILEKTLKALTAGISVTEKEHWEHFKKSKESAKLEYILAESEKIEFNEPPDLEKLKNFFEKNQADYKIPEKRSALYVFFSNDALKEDISVTEDEIEKYYQENEERFTDPERVQVSRIFLPFPEGGDSEEVRTEAQNILNKISSGEDFSELAKSYSKDEKAESGGDWGEFEWRSLSSQEQEVIALLEAGKNSDILEIENGLSIIKVTQKEPSTVKPLTEVKTTIENIIKDQKSRALASKKIEELEKSALKEKSLDAAAQIMGYTIKDTGLLNQGEELVDIDPSGAISQAIFQLEENGISPPIYTYSGTALAQLKTIESDRPAELEEVMEEVREDYINVMKKEKTLELIEKAQEELPGKTLEEIADKYDALEYKTINDHRRDQYIGIIGENQEVDNLVFSLPLNQYSPPLEYEGGYMLFRVTDRTEITKEDFENASLEEKQSLLEEKKNKFFTSFLNKYQEEKGVKIKYDLFMQINEDVLSRFGIE